MTQDKIKSFTDLNVWKEGHSLVLMVYKVRKFFPDDEKFGLTNQLCRAAVSITSNVAEGFGRFSYKDKLRFYYNSLGSLYEVQNQLLIARDLEYLQRDTFHKLAEKTVVVSKLLHSFISKTKTFIE